MIDLGPPHGGIEVVPDEVANVGVVLSQVLDGFVKVVGVQFVDNRVDINFDAIFVRVFQCSEGALKGARGPSKLFFHIWSGAVNRHMDKLQTCLCEVFGEFVVSESVAVGDHPNVKSLVSGVSGDLWEFGVERRLAARQNDAEILTLNKVVDQHLHGVKVVSIGRRWVRAEPAEMITMTNDLDITDVCHELSFDEGLISTLLGISVEESGGECQVSRAVFGGRVFSKNCPPGPSAGRGSARSWRDRGESQWGRSQGRG